MKVEKNTPLPGPTRSNYRDIYDQMQPGDSVLFDTELEARTFYTAAYRCRGYKMVRRKSRQGWRVWRVNEEIMAKLERQSFTIEKNIPIPPSEFRGKKAKAS